MKTIFSFLLLCYALNAKAGEDVCADICAKLLGKECLIGDLPAFMTDPSATACMNVLITLNPNKGKIIECAIANANEKLAGTPNGFIACLKG